MNRFADKPIECSVIGFSVRLEALSSRAQSVIEEAEKRSFLLRESGTSGARGDVGLQNDRATKQVWDKFYMNRLLCPRFDLGILIGGLHKLPTHEAEAIFGETNDRHYELVRGQWERKLMWPFGRNDVGSSSRSLFE